MNGREAAETLTPELSRQLSVIAGAMGAGIILLCGVIALMHLACVKSPTPEQVRFINLLVGAAMAGAVVAIFASEVVWKVMLRRLTPDSVVAGVQTAFIVRTSLREASAMFGCVAALLAAMQGVLRVYPAYWAALAPAGLFLGYLAMHWPSLDNLKSEVASALPQ